MSYHDKMKTGSRLNSFDVSFCTTSHSMNLGKMQYINSKKYEMHRYTSPVSAVTAIKSIFGDHIIKSITNEEGFSSVCRNGILLFWSYKLKQSLWEHNSTLSTVCYALCFTAINYVQWSSLGCKGFPLLMKSWQNDKKTTLMAENKHVKRLLVLFVPPVWLYLSLLLNTTWQMMPIRCPQGLHIPLGDR